MPKKYNWSEDQDRQITEMRRDRKTLPEIAAVFNVSRHLVSDRLRHLGVEVCMNPAPVLTTARMALDDHRRGPLPAGHFYTWGLLTAGTVLEGAPYQP